MEYTGIMCFGECTVYCANYEDGKCRFNWTKVDSIEEAYAIAHDTAGNIHWQGTRTGKHTIRT